MSNQLMSTQLLTSSTCNQGIIDSTGMETFAKGPELAKLMAEAINTIDRTTINIIKIL